MTTMLRHEAIPLLAACDVVLHDLHPVTGVDGLDQHRACLVRTEHTKAVLALATQVAWVVAAAGHQDPDDQLVDQLVAAAGRWAVQHGHDDHASTEHLAGVAATLHDVLGPLDRFTWSQRQVMLGRDPHTGLAVDDMPVLFEVGR